MSTSQNLTNFMRRQRNKRIMFRSISPCENQGNLARLRILYNKLFRTNEASFGENAEQDQYPGISLDQRMFPTLFSSTLSFQNNQLVNLTLVKKGFLEPLIPGMTWLVLLAVQKPCRRNWDTGSRLSHQIPLMKNFFTCFIPVAMTVSLNLTQVTISRGTLLHF